MNKWKISPEHSEPHQHKVNPPGAKHSSAEDIQRMMELFIPETPHCRLDNLILTEPVDKQIKMALARIRHRDVLYDQWNFKQNRREKGVAINLSGPPGVGKTSIAKAIAQALELNFINADYTNIESKFPGDTAKAIKAAFMQAKHTGAVLFFDEADSILSKRLSNPSQSADISVNSSRNTMFKEMELFNGVVIFATNLAQSYDRACIRRIFAHVDLKLPDYAQRVKLWQQLIPDEMPVCQDVCPDWLAQHSEGFAGGDIVKAIELAATLALMRGGAKARLSRADLQTGIAHRKAASQTIGAEGVVERRSEIVPPEKLPSDVKSEYDAAMSTIAALHPFPASEESYSNPAPIFMPDTPPAVAPYPLPTAVPDSVPPVIF